MNDVTEIGVHATPFLADSADPDLSLDAARGQLFAHRRKPCHKSGSCSGYTANAVQRQRDLRRTDLHFVRRCGSRTAELRVVLVAVETATVVARSALAALVGCAEIACERACG
eukprot:6567924-Prymnesium_polylepis.1